MNTESLIERSHELGSAHRDQHHDQIRPKTLDHYIGQESVTHALSIFIQAAKQRGESLDHVLLYGPPGLGKTTLAQIIACEMRAQIRQTSGPVIEKPGELAALLSSMDRHDVLFIDEIHRLHPSIEEILYPAMEDFKLDIMIGDGPGAKSVQIDLPPFTLIGATTRSGSLTAPLRARFGMTHRLELYKPDCLSHIISRSAKVLDFDIDSQACLYLAERSRGTPRIANRLLRRCRDFAQAHNLHFITQESVTHALELLGIDAQGLDNMDRRYLRLLSVDFSGGPVGLDSLAVSMGESRQTLEDVIEPFLIQKGYVLRTQRGRVIGDISSLHPHI